MDSSKDTNPEYESDGKQSLGQFHITEQQHGSFPEIPDDVSDFIQRFYQNHKKNNIYELNSNYDNEFNKKTEKYYKDRTWPASDAIAVHLDLEYNDIFLTLYRELYFRHIYSRFRSTLRLQQRVASYENYRDLFHYILNANDPLELPHSWLWDIVDEFIYQFQAFNQLREQSQKSEEESALLQSRPDVWSNYSVLSTLRAIVTKSRINEVESAGKQSNLPLDKMLGYFSAVGLLRVHCLMGDYTMALKSIDSTVLVNNRKPAFRRLHSYHVAAYYHVGYAYLMMRRYADAIKVLAHGLSYIQRNKQHLPPSHSNPIAKKSDRMWGLLAICCVLSPTRLDETTHLTLREKHGEHMHFMEKGDDEAVAIFKLLWKQSNPFENGVEGALAKVQEHVFLADIHHQIKLPALRSFLKLYTSMSLEKLAKFLEISTDDLKALLLTAKQRTRQYRWLSGNLLEGEYVSASDLDFCLKQDMLYIAESKIGRRYADWFLRNINRCDDNQISIEQRV